MALTNEDLKQIIEALKAEGFRFQLPNENYENVKNFRLEEGELINLPNLSQIRVGNGFDNIENLPFLNYSETPIFKEDLPAVQAQKLWLNIQAKTTVLQTWQAIMPKEILGDFIKLKPRNFSLLRGEELPEEAIASAYWETAPNAEGAFLRNYHFENEENPNNDSDLKRELGSFQDQEVKAHDHGIMWSYSKSRQTTNPMNPDWLPESEIEARYSLNGLTFEYKGRLQKTTTGPYKGKYESHYIKYDYSSNVDAFKTIPNGGAETRPKNIAVITVWRTY